ncbi:MAG: SLC13 family permease [Hyphomicrobiaceae bacterium]|nr:SLC13 family permease [Hyphomicrobiaceae bacterium]
MIVGVVFGLVYLGMAVGRLPGLQVDRAWMAAAGASVLIATGALTLDRAAEAIDTGALVLLFALMVLSAQFEISGFYARCADGLARVGSRPLVLLAATVALGGVLSALLVNDIVVLALTPILINAAVTRGLDPRPLLLALAGAANAGSAATLIGNPQNILIGQAGELDFWTYAAIATPPAATALLVVFSVIALMWRGCFSSTSAVKADSVPAAVAPEVQMAAESDASGGTAAEPAVAIDRAALWKAGLALVALLVLFATPLPRAASALIIAILVLASRRRASGEMIGRVNWNLLILFIGLFIITEAFADSGFAAPMAALMDSLGFAADSAAALALASAAGSNVIGNVPFVMLLLEVERGLSQGTLAGLALFSTLAGNLLLTGSVVNLIVVETARQHGVRLGFLSFAAVGIPAALLSMAIAAAWLVATGQMNP